MNSQLENDIWEFSRTFPLANDLRDASVMITGATGLIGSVLVRCLLSLDKNISITVPVRDLEKAAALYKNETDRIRIISCNLQEYIESLEGHFDFIIHCASPTVGKYMNEFPVETYELAIESTRALLKYAKMHDVRGVVYVSSLEYYGQNYDDGIITEEMQGYINPTSARSSYPMGKRAAEYLCFAYATEYGVPVKIARLTQTFGAGVSKDDNRVFAQFARCVLYGTDIVLHTTGESAKPYCYTTDCISAILYILLKGENGESYNVANPDTYISIRAMADFLRENFNPEIDVRIEIRPEMGYAPVTKLRLSIEKLISLGWKPKYDLKEMYVRLILHFRTEMKDERAII